MERGERLVLLMQLLVSQGKQQISEKQGTGGGFQAEKELLVLVLGAEQCSELKC